MTMLGTWVMQRQDQKKIEPMHEKGEKTLIPDQEMMAAGHHEAFSKNDFCLSSAHSSDSLTLNKPDTKD
jgi:hypothetical protein